MLLRGNSLVTTKNIKEKNFVLAVIQSDTSDCIRGNFETLVSKFSHEIRFSEADGVLCKLQNFFL